MHTIVCLQTNCCLELQKLWNLSILMCEMSPDLRIRKCFDFITILWLEITILFQVWKLNYDNANLLGNAYIRNCTFQIVAWRIKKLRNLSILDVWNDSGLQNPKMNWFHNNSLSGFKVNCIQTLNPGLLLRVVPRGPRHCICKQICCIRITSRLGSLSKSTTELNLIWKIIKHVYKANCCLEDKS